MISNLIKIELAHINTSHPDFIGGSRAVAQLMDRVPDDTRPPMVSETVPVAAVSEPPSGPPGRRPSGAAGRDTASTNPFAGFFGGGKKKDGAQGDEVVTLPQVPETMRRVGASPSERERIETEIIKSLISSYFDIVRKNWMDLVPKACMHFMVKHAKENMQNELVSKLYKEDLLSEVMRETPEVAQRRQEIQEMRTLLHRALEIVNEVRTRALSTPPSRSCSVISRARSAGQGQPRSQGLSRERDPGTHEKGAPAGSRASGRGDAPGPRGDGPRTPACKLVSTYRINETSARAYTRTWYMY